MQLVASNSMSLKGGGRMDAYGKHIRVHLQLFEGQITSSRRDGMDAPWDRATCLSPINRGHLDVLQLTRENGRPWDGGLLFMRKAVSTSI
jgi:hypothetical protein